MKNQSRFISASQAFIALLFLFQVFLHFQSALNYGGVKNDYLADNWGIILGFLLSTIFGLGWWVGIFVDKLMQLKGWKASMPTFLGILLLFGLLVFGSLAFFSPSFVRYAMMASGYSLISGFLLRLSMIGPIVMVKQQGQN